MNTQKTNNRSSHPIAWISTAGCLVVVGCILALQGLTHASRAHAQTDVNSATPVLQQAPPQVVDRNADRRLVRRWNRERVAFWLSIYTLYDSRQVLIHDTVYPHVIYEVVDLRNPNHKNLDKEKLVAQKKKYYRSILKEFSKGNIFFHSLNRDQWRVYNLFKTIKEPHKYRSAARRSRVRAQDGMRDLFKEAIRRSGRYRDIVAAGLKSCSLPEQLIALVFVESLFYPKAISKAGAAGLWQIMPKTARGHLKITRAIDERFDPQKSTRAACAILKQYRTLLDGSWPLAITAYNHGPGGMLRAKKRHSTEDLEKIIRSFESRTFGFASKNFYAEYLAAVEAYYDSEKYFGELAPESPLAFDEILLPFAIVLKKLSGHTGVDTMIFEELNPVLQKAVLRSKIKIPKSTILRVPMGQGTAVLTALQSTRFEPQP